MHVCARVCVCVCVHVTDLNYGEPVLCRVGSFSATAPHEQFNKVLWGLNIVFCVQSPTKARISKPTPLQLRLKMAGSTTTVTITQCLIIFCLLLAENTYLL